MLLLLSHTHNSLRMDVWGICMYVVCVCGNVCVCLSLVAIIVVVIVVVVVV